MYYSAIISRNYTSDYWCATCTECLINVNFVWAVWSSLCVDKRRQCLIDWLIDWLIFNEPVTNVHVQLRNEMFNCWQFTAVHLVVAAINWHANYWQIDWCVVPALPYAISKYVDMIAANYLQRKPLMESSLSVCPSVCFHSLYFLNQLTCQLEFYCACGS